MGLLRKSIANALRKHPSTCRTRPESTWICTSQKCSASNRIIAAKDNASIQMVIADVDEKTGRMLPTYKTYAICGAIRRMGESDDCINRLAKKDGILAKNF